MRHITSRLKAWSAPLLLAGWLGLSVVALADAGRPQSRPVTGPSNMAAKEFNLLPTTFADLAGWDTDDHLAAYKAFMKSCRRVTRRSGGGDVLKSICNAALNDPRKMTKASAKSFFEANFVPHRVKHAGQHGLLTGYYEPTLEGSRTPSASFSVPIYKRPPELVNMVAESERGAKSHTFTHMRQTDGGFEPFATRAEIEQGALKDRGLELLYLKDAVDTFFMHIQGSGMIQLDTGEKVRITYDGKNGYPYTSIGRVLIDRGEANASTMSLQSLTKWIKANGDRGRQLMWENKSFVFFRELNGEEGDGAMGVDGITLTTGRSLAVDTGFHQIGLPIYVISPGLTHARDDGGPFQRLMIAQDVGSAIKGPERGDIYFGSGKRAGQLAGITKQPGSFFVLVPAASSQNPSESLRRSASQ